MIVRASDDSVGFFLKMGFNFREEDITRGGTKEAWEVLGDKEEGESDLEAIKIKSIDSWRLFEQRKRIDAVGEVIGKSKNKA